MEKVFLTKINYKNAQEIFKKAIDAFYTEKEKFRHICIKINLCDYRMADSGATTDPFLLDAFLNVLKRKFNPESITVIENDATSVEVDSLFNLLGFRALVKHDNVELLNAAKHEWIKKNVPGGALFRELDVLAIWDASDLRINFAKLKTNSLTKTTGCLKNMFGLLRQKRKSLLHSRISEVIADINTVMKTDFCVVDGLIGQEGNGPAFGIPKRCELLVAGKDPVAVDSCCARLMGFVPYCVKHIRICSKRNIGSMHYDLITDIPQFSYKDYTFKFSRIEYFTRTLIRKFTTLGAAG
jgi:uncharacterized protein (DUF362 family)